MIFITPPMRDVNLCRRGKNHFPGGVSLFSASGLRYHRQIMLHLKSLSKDFAGTPLFTNLTWHLKKGERVGLVGENGAGKSTLMRIIAGQVEHSSGELQFARGATVGYLPQDGIVTRGTPLFQ